MDGSSDPESLSISSEASVVTESRPGRGEAAPNVEDAEDVLPNIDLLDSGLAVLLFPGVLTVL